MKRLRLLTVLVVCMFSTVAMANNDYPRGELLINPAELSAADAAKKPSVDANITVLDVRPRSDYDVGHVPGAVWIDVAEWSKSFENGRDPEAWSKRIAEQGIANDSTAVVYDDGAAKDAARVWWLLRYWGVENAKLLNGGFTAWQTANLPQQKEAPPQPKASDFKAEPHEQRLATKESILTSLKSDGDLQIVDARSEAEYCGTEPGKNKRGGAIPGAKNLEWSELLDPQTKQFKSAAELQKIFKEAGIQLDRPTAAHCQSGGRSSVMVFGMELMGGKNVGNYYRSWAEWGNAEDTPVEPGKAKR